ncbi:MAG TPA: BRO family protein [Nitrososphaera sp.]|nr:BRO family protein [Nitrososphaera sp.]
MGGSDEKKSIEWWIERVYVVYTPLGLKGCISEASMENSSPSVFDFEGKQVRFVGTSEFPEWIADDVGDALEIKNVRQNLQSFDDDEKGVCTIYTLGGTQAMLTVKEPGLYRLIFKSRKPVAERFRRWVFRDVLPSIRKTGSYSASESTSGSEDVIFRSQNESQVVTSFQFVLTSPPYIGSQENPITESSFTSAIQNGYGWKGNEKLLGDLLSELITYRGAYILRESPHRSYSLLEKQRSKRLDLIVRFDEIPETIFVYELKSDYVDYYDVNDTFGSKAYLQILLRDLCRNGVYFKKMVGCFVSPGGITSAALEGMKNLQAHLNQISSNGENIEIQLDSLLLYDLVRNVLYPMIVGRHSDEIGSFGAGFISQTIDPLCQKLINPEPWITDLRKSLKILKKASQKELLLNPSVEISLDFIQEAERIGLELEDQ